MIAFNSRVEELAWAAGFFEGEGCFVLQKGKTRRDGSRWVMSKAVLSQKDKELLEQFKSIVGFGAIYFHPHSGEIWQWTTSRKGETTKLFALIGSMLSPRRQARYAENKELEDGMTDQRRQKAQADCHPDRVSYARGKCSPCWQRDRYESTKVPCPNCLGRMTSKSLECYDCSRSHWKK